MQPLARSSFTNRVASPLGDIKRQLLRSTLYVYHIIHFHHTTFVHRASLNQATTRDLLEKSAMSLLQIIENELIKDATGAKMLWIAHRFFCFCLALAFHSTVPQPLMYLCLLGLVLLDLVWMDQSDWCMVQRYLNFALYQVYVLITMTFNHLRIKQHRREEERLQTLVKDLRGKAGPREVIDGQDTHDKIVGHHTILPYLLSGIAGLAMAVAFYGYTLFESDT